MKANRMVGTVEFEDRSARIMLSTPRLYKVNYRLFEIRIIATPIDETTTEFEILPIIEEAGHSNNGIVTAGYTIKGTGVDTANVEAAAKIAARWIDEYEAGH